jgi:hypothetical protein
MEIGPEMCMKIKGAATKLPRRLQTLGRTRTGLLSGDAAKAVVLDRRVAAAARVGSARPALRPCGASALRPCGASTGAGVCQAAPCASRGRAAKPENGPCATTLGERVIAVTLDPRGVGFSVGFASGYSSCSLSGNRETVKRLCVARGEPGAYLAPVKFMRNGLCGLGPEQRQGYLVRVFSRGACRKEILRHVESAS